MGVNGDRSPFDLTPAEAAALAELREVREAIGYEDHPVDDPARASAYIGALEARVIAHYVAIDDDREERSIAIREDALARSRAIRYRAERGIAEAAESAEVGRPASVESTVALIEYVLDASQERRGQLRGLVAAVQAIAAARDDAIREVEERRDADLAEIEAEVEAKLAEAKAEEETPEVEAKGEGEGEGDPFDYKPEEEK